MSFWYSDLEENMRLEIEEDEVVETQFEKTSLSQCDIYYKFRYTFNQFSDSRTDNVPTSLGEQKRHLGYLISNLKKFIIGDKFIAGIEHFKSGMEDAKPHVHIHFVSRTKKDTIVKSLKRNSGECLFQGNRQYSLGIEVNVNEDKFFRYPLKQQKGDTYKCVQYGNYFTKEKVIEMALEAHAVWITACEINVKKKEKKEDNDQLSDRLFNYLNKQILDTDLSIKINIQKFYIDEEKKPFNKATALGYFYNYKISTKRMTHEELAALW